MKIYLPFLCLLLWSLHAKSQNVENLLKKDSSSFLNSLRQGQPFQMNGSIGLNLRSYSAAGIEDRQTPFTTNMFGMLNFQVYGLNIPLTFILSNLDQNSVPFGGSYFNNFFSNQRDRLARLGISPYYKWIKIHAGHRYMNFSPFTLANHNFLGGGIELTPGKLRIAAMAGRLSKAEPVDLSLSRPNVPVYLRKGAGFKVGYGTNTDYIDLIFFYGKDDPNSIDLSTDTSSLVLPGENIVWSLKGQKQLFKVLSFDFEFARSGFTRDHDAPRLDQSSFFLYDNPVFRPRTNTTFRNAINTNLRWNAGKVQVSAGYQRIDPQYRTFGAYFFNEDFENFTLQVSAYNLGPVTFTVNGGLQRNNLDNSRPATYTRFIGLLNATYRKGTWVLGANVSNFQSNVNYVQNLDSDSLNVVIVTSDASLNLSKNITTDDGVTHGFYFVGGAQLVSQNIETPTGGEGTAMYYSNLSYSLQLPSKWNAQINGDLNRNGLGGVQQMRYGTGIRIGRPFFENKLDINVGTQYYLTRSGEDDRSATQWNQILRTTYRITRTQQINAQINYLINRRIQPGQSTNYREFIAMLSYQWQFQYNPGKKNSEQPTTDQ